MQQFIETCGNIHENTPYEAKTQRHCFKPRHVFLLFQKKNVYNIRYGHLFFPHVKLGCKIADDRGRTGKRSEPKWLLRRHKCE